MRSIAAAFMFVALFSFGAQAQSWQASDDNPLSQSSMDRCFRNCDYQQYSERLQARAHQEEDASRSRENAFWAQTDGDDGR